MRIAFIIRTLETGGAERQLTELAKALALRGHEVLVLVFYGVGPWAAEIRAAGGEVRQLHKRGRWDLLRTAREILTLLNSFDPDVVHGYMAGANIMLALLRPWLGRSRAVFGIRGTYTVYPSLSFRVVLTLERWFSRFADIVICNSNAARERCLRMGFRADKIVVIHNGIDTERFRLDADMRESQRREWGFSSDHIVVGVVARIDIMKDHETFIDAASRLVRHVPAARFVCVGGGEDASLLARLQSLGKELERGGLLRWEGATSFPERVFNALDVGVQPSQFNEGFPNAIAEGMACGLRYVATDVGDAGMVVGDPRFVVPPRDPMALADALANLIRSGAYRDRAGPRKRIERHFSVEHLAANTEEVLLTLQSGRFRSRSASG